MVVRTANDGTETFSQQFATSESIELTFDITTTGLEAFLVDCFPEFWGGNGVVLAYGQWAYNIQPPTGKAALRAAIAEAESRSQAVYTPASWSFMQVELLRSRNMYNNPNATETNMNTMAGRLWDAINALVPVNP